MSNDSDAEFEAMLEEAAVQSQNGSDSNGPATPAPATPKGGRSISESDYILIDENTESIVPDPPKLTFKNFENTNFYTTDVMVVYILYHEIEL